MSDPSENSAFSFVDMEHQILNLWEETDAFKQSLEKTRAKAPHFLRRTAVCHGSAASRPSGCEYDKGHRAPVLDHEGALRFAAFWLGLLLFPQNMKSTNSLVCRPGCRRAVGRGWLQRRVPGHCAGLCDEWWLQTRIGRWIDFDDDYKTMDTWYMESVWWVFKQLWEKGLIYQGVKVVPLSTALAHPLRILRPPLTIKTCRILQ